jgi:maleate isomerase
MAATAERSMTRIGLIIPSSNRMVEQEMVRHLPPGVAAPVARLRMNGAHRVGIDELLPRVTDAAATLVDARCDVVAFHCTANSMAEGLAGADKLIAALRQAGAPRATTTASAIRAGLDALSARRIVLLTPYPQATTDHEAEFLRGAGYEILAARGFALKGSDDYCGTPASFWRDRAIDAARPDADCYLISCANISTFPVIADIEQRLGRPVVTSNQAVMFDALRVLGIADGRAWPGRVFEALREGAAAHRVHP